MKHLKLFFAFMLMAVLSIGQLWATEVTVTWTASTGALGSAISSEGGTANGTIATTSGTEISYNWSYTRTLATLKSGKSDYVSMSGSYMQLGSSNAGEDVEFRTSNIPGTIKSVTVLAGSKDSRHTGTITVGGTDYNAGSISAWASSAGDNWTGTGSSSGEIVISISCNGKKSPIYIASITVVYEEGGTQTCATPTFTPAAGAVVSGTQVSISCSTEGAAIHYTTNGTNPTASSSTYSAAIPVTSEMTIKAIAVKNGLTNSSVASASYTIVEPDYTTIAGFLTDKPNAEKYIEFSDDVVVTGVNGKNVFVQDESGNAICLYFSANSSWTKGHKVTGMFKAKYATYGNMPEMSITDNGTIAATETADIPTPADITSLAEATINANMCKYVTLKGVYFQNQSLSNKAVDLKDGSDNVLKFYDNLSVTNGKVLPLTATACDVTGIIISYKSGDNSVNEILPVDAACIVAGTATLPTLSTPGSTDAENPTTVPNAQEITVTPATGFTCTLNSAALENATNVAITNTESNTAIAVTAARDYYTNASATYYFKANVAGTKYAIEIVQPLSGGTLEADFAETEAGNTVTLIATPTNSHFTFDGWTVKEKDNSSAIAETVANNQFTMPEYAVTVTGSFTEDDKVTFSFAKGEADGTETAPGAIANKYAEDEFTLPECPFTYSDHKFTGWKHSGTNDVHQPGSYTVTEADATAGAITFTAQWEELSPWASVYTSNVTLSGATQSTVVIDEDSFDAMKAGTSSASGSINIAIPANATTLHFHASGWNGASVTLNLTAPDGVTITPASVNLTADEGVQGSETTYTLENDPRMQAYFSVTLSGNTDAFTLNIANTAKKKQFVLFGVNAEYPAAITLNPTSKDFGEVKENASAQQEFTITPNAMSTGTLVASIIGTDAAKFSVGTISENKVTVTFTPGEIGGPYSASLKIASNNAEVTAALSGTGITAATPEISVDEDEIAFGNVVQNSTPATQSVGVTLSNIDANGVNAEISGSAFTISPENLTANGSIVITPITTTPGVYSETLTLTATGATSKTVTVTMTVVDQWAYTYSSNVTVGDEEYTIKILKSGSTTEYDEYVGQRYGTSKAAGVATINVPANTQTLHFHAAAWNNEDVQLKVTMSDGEVTLFEMTGTNYLVKETNISGNGKEYIISTPANEYYSIDLSGQTINTDEEITFTATKGYRFALFGVNQVGGTAPELQSIAIAGDMTNKTGYKAGDNLDLTGLTVSATYTLDGVAQTPVDITNNEDLTWTYNPITENQTSVDLTASFGGKTATKTVNGLEVASADPVITTDPASYINFGTVTPDANVEAKTITVTLTNVAAATAVLGGTNPDAFSIDKTALVNGDVITISVASTATIGTYSATVTITDDASAATEKVINISLKVEDVETAVSNTSKWVAATELADGMQVLITGVKNNVVYAMAEQKDNNRASVAGTCESDIFTSGEGTMAFSLEEQSEGKYAIKTSNGKYLYAASSSSNHLKTRDEIGDDGKAVWSISINENNTASIVANCETTSWRNTMQFNPNGNNAPVFACYGSASQTAVALYVPYVATYTITYAANGGSGDAPDAFTKKEGETFNVAENPFTAPEGKEFDKWNDGTNDYAPGVTYTVGTANVVLTAYWKDATPVTPDPQPETPDYTRNVTPNRYGTICIPEGGRMVEGILFEISYRNDVEHKIYFDEIVDGTMVAGRPYIYWSNSSQIGIIYDGKTAQDPGSYNGLIGSFEGGAITANEGNYILYANKIYEVDRGGASVGANKAYISMNAVPTEPQQAPGRRRVSLQIEGEQVATDILNAELNAQPMKVVIDNQLFIIREGKMYDMTGRLVK